MLYVPGMNYSTLLTRSVDFEDYAPILYPSYPDEGERPLLLAMIQMMWDRGEPNGYANHMTSDPLPGTPAHKVLIEMAYGDHQVANVATEVEARTIGAPLRYPTLDPAGAPRDSSTSSPRLPTLGDLAGGRGWQRHVRLGHRAEARRRHRGSPRNRPAADHQHRADDSFGVDPHDTVISTSPLIRAPDRELPQARRADHRSVRLGPLLRRGLDRPALSLSGSV